MIESVPDNITLPATTLVKRWVYFAWACLPRTKGRSHDAPLVNRLSLTPNQPRVTDFRLLSPCRSGLVTARSRVWFIACRVRSSIGCSSSATEPRYTLIRELIGVTCRRSRSPEPRIGKYSLQSFYRLVNCVSMGRVYSLDCGEHVTWPHPCCRQHGTSGCVRWISATCLRRAVTSAPTPLDVNEDRRSRVTLH